ALRRRVRHNRYRRGPWACRSQSDNSSPRFCCGAVSEAVMENPEADGDSGRFAYEGLDRVIHEKARLGILTSLVAHPKGLLFGDLKQLCGLTDGNLSRHLQVLQQAGLIAIDKKFEHNRPQTICRITQEGRTRYLDYLNVL